MLDATGARRALGTHARTHARTRARDGLVVAVLRESGGKMGVREGDGEGEGEGAQAVRKERVRRRPWGVGWGRGGVGWAR